MNVTQILDAMTLSAQYDLGQRCRSKHIIAHPCTTRNLFYASTCTLKDQNKTHLLEYKEEENKISSLEVYENEGIIRQVVPDFHNEERFYTVYSTFDANGEEKTGFNLKRSCVDGKGESIESISQPIFNKSCDTYVHSLVSRLKDKNKIYFGETNHLNVFDIVKQEVVLKLNEGESGATYSDVDPLHNDYVASAQNNGSILIHDIRTQKPEFVIKNAHRLRIHDIDFNPLKLYYFQSVGEDSTIKFWELRKPNLPMKVIDKFNNIEVDGLIKIYDQENTVYSISWSNFSSWLFASVSYQGNVIVNMVPSSIKHSIQY